MPTSGTRANGSDSWSRINPSTCSTSHARDRRFQPTRRGPAAAFLGALIDAGTGCAAVLVLLAAASGAAEPAGGPSVPVQQGKDYPIQPVPFTAVKVEDAFWSPRLETNRTVTIPVCFEKCEETGRIANFQKAGGLMEGKFEGIYFNDSDVY